MMKSKKAQLLSVSLFKYEFLWALPTGQKCFLQEIGTRIWTPQSFVEFLNRICRMLNSLNYSGTQDGYLTLAPRRFTWLLLRGLSAHYLKPLNSLKLSFHYIELSCWRRHAWQKRMVTRLFGDLWHGNHFLAGTFLAYRNLTSLATHSLQMDKAVKIIIWGK